MVDADAERSHAKELEISLGGCGARSFRLRDFEDVQTPCSGAPIQGATLTLTASSGARLVTKTDHAGVFRYQALATGEYQASIKKQQRGLGVLLRLSGGADSEPMGRWQTRTLFSGSSRVESRLPARLPAHRNCQSLCETQHSSRDGSH